MEHFLTSLRDGNWALAWPLVVGWLMSSGLRILIILVLLTLALRLSQTILRRALELSLRTTGSDPLRDLSAQKRRDTLLGIFNRVAGIFLVVLAALMIFRELSFDVVPLLAGASVIGVAIGLGAQGLIKDLISGGFIIFENQFDVGDVVTIGTASGLVEAIHLRTTLLRGQDGTLHIIPNGEISRVSVLTKDWSRFVLDVDVAWASDVDHVTAVMRRVLEQYAAENPTLVIAPPEILGIESFGDGSIKIRALVKTLPIKQWDAGRAIRRLIKIEFEKEGIQLPQREILVQRRSQIPPA